MKNVLVTGGAGFIGSHVVDLFISNGYQVVIADNLSTGKMENVNQEAVFYNIDICDRETLDQIFKEHKINFVVHLAAQVSVGVSMENPILDTDINVIGTVNLLECCRKFAIKKFIYSSSAAIYGEPQYLPIDEEHPRVPQSFYGLSKDIGEKYIEMYSDTYGVDYTILRYSNVYGPRQDSAGEGLLLSLQIDY